MRMLTRTRKLRLHWLLALMASIALLGLSDRTSIVRSETGEEHTLNEVASTGLGFLECLDWHEEFANCMSGPGGTPAPVQPIIPEICQTFYDLDGDGDVDFKDYSLRLDAPSLEIGFAYDQPYECRDDGDVAPAYPNSHDELALILTLRAVGFEQGLARIYRSVVMADTGQVLIPYGFGSNLNLLALPAGVTQTTNLLIAMYPLEPGEADRREAYATFSLVQPLPPAPPTAQATITTRLVFDEVDIP